MSLSLSTALLTLIQTHHALSWPQTLFHWQCVSWQCVYIYSKKKKILYHTFHIKKSASSFSDTFAHLCTHITIRGVAVPPAVRQRSNTQTHTHAHVQSAFSFWALHCYVLFKREAYKPMKELLSAAFKGNGRRQVAWQDRRETRRRGKAVEWRKK